jgi:hypothetical protein
VDSTSSLLESIGRLEARYGIMGSGNGTYNASENEQKLKQLEYNPIKQDTTMLYRYSSTGAFNTTPGTVFLLSPE